MASLEAPAGSGAVKQRETHPDSEDPNRFRQPWAAFSLVLIKHLADLRGVDVAEITRLDLWTGSSDGAHVHSPPSLMQRFCRLWKMVRSVWSAAVRPPSQSEAKVVISLWGDDYGGWISAAKLILSSAFAMSAPLSLALPCYPPSLQANRLVSGSRFQRPCWSLCG